MLSNVNVMIGYTLSMEDAIHQLIVLNCNFQVSRCLHVTSVYSRMDTLDMDNAYDIQALILFE